MGLELFFVYNLRRVCELIFLPPMNEFPNTTCETALACPLPWGAAMKGCMWGFCRRAVSQPCPGVLVPSELAEPKSWHVLVLQKECAPLHFIFRTCLFKDLSFSVNSRRILFLWLNSFKKKRKEKKTGIFVTIVTYEVS